MLLAHILGLDAEYSQGWATRRVVHGVNAPRCFARPQTLVTLIVFHLFIYWGHVCYGELVHVRGQLTEVCSLLSCGSRGQKTLVIGLSSNALTQRATSSALAIL